jgi:hypothetical protein
MWGEWESIATCAQLEDMESGVDILVATPGWLSDLLVRARVSLLPVHYVVLDEADHKLDMRFKPQNCGANGYAIHQLVSIKKGKFGNFFSKHCCPFGKTYASKDAIGTQYVQMLYNVLLKLLDRRLYIYLSPLSGADEVGGQSLPSINEGDGKKADVG